MIVFTLESSAVLIVSNNVLTKPSQIDLPDLSVVEEADLKRIEQLLNRHQVNFDRPKACPLESRSNLDILTKIETIRTLFTDNCLDSDQARLDELLRSAQDIQTAINQANSNQNNNSIEPSPFNFNLGDGVVISGQQVATLFNNINNIFINGRCKLDKAGFFEHSADVIQNFAQMGLLVPNQNGLIVAGGGIGLASILRVLHTIFTSRFNFSDMRSRQTFIKLNCAFYELRRDIQKAGLMEIPTSDHEASLIEIKLEAERLIIGKEELSKNYQELTDFIEAIVNNRFTRSNAVLANVIEALNQLAKMVEKNRPSAQDFSNHQLKLNFINKLGELAPKVFVALKTYLDFNPHQIGFFESMLLAQLEKIDPVNQKEEIERLLAMENARLYNIFSAELSFNLQRILTSLGQEKELYIKDILQSIFVDDMTIADFIQSTRDQYLGQVSLISDLTMKLSQAQKRLERILKVDHFRDNPEGSESIVNILTQYDEIAAQIYGKWGYDFVNYTVQNSIKYQRTFTRNFKRFSKKFLDQLDSDFDQPSFKARDLNRISELNQIYACQDAFLLRRQWRLSEGLVQQAYDFIETNKELFHSQVPKGLFRIKSKFRRLQHHHKSSLVAEKILDGGAVSQKMVDKYIDAKYGVKRRSYLGKAMTEVEAVKPQAVVMQKLIDFYRCDEKTSPRLKESLDGQPESNNN